MKYLFIFIWFLAAPPILADELPVDPYTTLHTLPTPTIQEVNGEQLMCTTAKGWQKTLLLANDYRGLYMWRLKIEGVLDAHQEVITAYELKITSYEDTIKLLQENRNYQKTRVGELESALLSGGKGHKVEKILMWGVILLETVAIGALGVTSFTQTY